MDGRTQPGLGANGDLEAIAQSNSQRRGRRVGLTIERCSEEPWIGDGHRERCLPGAVGGERHGLDEAAPVNQRNSIGNQSVEVG